MAQNVLIYVVEDDDSIRMLLSMALKSAGYDIVEFINADAMLVQIKHAVPDAMLLDIMMDGTDGISAMRQIRSNDKLRNLPVMMLTARDTETDKVIGLDAGADDYMTKPFGVMELCARVRALLRRGKSSDKRACLLSGELKLDTITHEVSVGNNLLDITLKEFVLLRVLMQAAPATLSREILLQEVWGYDFAGETRTLDMHIGTLRSKLNEDAAAPKYIKTVRGVGYRFIGAIQ